MLEREDTCWRVCECKDLSFEQRCLSVSVSGLCLLCLCVCVCMLCVSPYEPGNKAVCECVSAELLTTCALDRSVAVVPETLLFLLDPIAKIPSLEDCEASDSLLSISLRSSGTFSTNFFFRSARSKQSCGEMPILIMMSLMLRMESVLRSILSSSSRC